MSCSISPECGLRRLAHRALLARPWPLDSWPSSRRRRGRCRRRQNPPESRAMGPVLIASSFSGLEVSIDVVSVIGFLIACSRPCIATCSQSGPTCRDCSVRARFLSWPIQHSGLALQRLAPRWPPPFHPGGVAEATHRPARCSAGVQRGVDGRARGLLVHLRHRLWQRGTRPSSDPFERHLQTGPVWAPAWNSGRVSARLLHHPKFWHAVSLRHRQRLGGRAPSP